MSIWQEVARMIEGWANTAQWRADQIVTQLGGGQVAPASGTDRGTVALSDSNPADLGTTDPGNATDVSRSDHIHGHGDLAGGTLHDEATNALAGFVPAASGSDGDVLTIASGVWAPAAPPGGSIPLTTRGDLLTRDASTNIRLPIGASGTFVRSDGTDPSWAALIAADIPNLAASKITSGQLALARGGTAADLSATGGTSQVLKQTSAGAAVTVAQLAQSDISGTVAIANGGTGQTAAVAAFNALSPVTTRGDLIIRGATNNDRLTIGSGGKVLRSDGVDPSWQTLDAGDIGAGTLLVARGGTGLGSYTAGDLLYASGSTTLTALAIGASGRFLKSTGSAPSWVKPDFPDLSNYATGSWTPTLVGSTIAGTFTYDATNTGGSYTQIGNLVYIRGRIRITAVATAPTGNLTIKGLPTTSANTGRNLAGGVTIVSFTGITLSAGYTQFVADVLDSTSNLRLLQGGSNIATALLTGAANFALVGGVFNVGFAGFYEV